MVVALHQSNGDKAPRGFFGSLRGLRWRNMLSPLLCYWTGLLRVAILLVFAVDGMCAPYDFAPPMCQ